MKSILVTGFEPFLGEQMNPSEKLLAQLSPQFDKLLLHVSFSKGFDQLQSQLQNKHYDFVLLLGQAGGRTKIGMERIAINRIDSEYPDEAGHVFSNTPISKDGPEACISPLPLRDWQCEAESQGLPIEISNSAGLFVCNYVYYQTLQILKRPESALFLHFPFLPEQVVAKPAGTASMDFSTMKQGLDFILARICGKI